VLLLGPGKRVLIWLNGDSLIGESESSSAMEGREIVSCLDIVLS